MANSAFSIESPDLSNYLTITDAQATYVPLTRTVNGLALSSNITLTTADINDSVNRRYVTDAQLTVIGNTSGTNTGDQFLFGTIAVSGQSNVVADSTNDTLTLVAGTNITITTNAGTDSITINSTSGGSGDVVGPASATDNAIAVYDGTTGKLIKNSSVTIAAGVVTATGFVGPLTGNVTGNADTATTATNVTVANEATDTTCFPVFVTAATGNLPPKSNANLTYNSNTGALGSTSFVGALTGNASTATALQNARTIGGVSFDGTANIVPQTIQMVDDSADTTCFILFGNASGSQSQQPKTNTGLTYNASTNAVGATTFTGAFVGNVTGNVSGSSGSTTGNAATATALQTPRTIGGVSFDGTANIVPQTIQIVDAGGDTTTFPMLATSATGSLQPTTDANLTFNATTNALSTTTFIGALTGNADTATSATSATTATNIATANETGDSTCFPVFVTASGTQASIPPKTNSTFGFDSTNSTLSVTNTATTITTASQPNITTVGTLVGGNATAVVDSATTSAAGKVELLTDAEFQTGTDNTRAATAANVFNSLGFSDYFESTQQTLTAGGQLTVAHGLGRKPILVKLVLQCTTADLNYSIGDELTEWANGYNSSATGVSAVPDSTNIVMRFGSGSQVFVIMNKTTGAYANMTPGSWRLVARAWG